MAQPPDPSDIPDGPIKLDGAKLDFARRAAQLSQAEFARRARISPSHASRILHNQVGVHQDVMRRILRVFGGEIHFEELLAPDPGRKGRDPR